MITFRLWVTSYDKFLFYVLLLSRRIIVRKSTHYAVAGLMTLISRLRDTPLYISTATSLPVFLFPGIFKVYRSRGFCKQQSPKLGVAVSRRSLVFPRYSPMSGSCPILCSSLFYMFQETPYTSPEWLLAIYIPPIRVKRLPVLRGLSCLSRLYTFFGWPFGTVGRETS